MEGGGCGNDRCDNILWDDTVKILLTRYAVFSEVGKYLDWIADNFNMLPPDDFVYS